MEKASKKIAEVEVELTDGTKRTLATLTMDDLPKVKLDGKPVMMDGKEHFTSLSLKRGIVKDTPTEYIERRLFKYGPSQQQPEGSSVVMYDKPLPVTEEAFSKIPIGYRLAMYWKADRIDSDHVHASGDGRPVEEKILAKASKLGLPPAALEAMKQAMKKHGYGK
jgi:hypothetical protein